MVKYLRKLGFFLLGFLIILIGIFGFNRFTISNSFQDFTNTNILMIGDSHTVYSLNPKSFKNAKNISLESESYVPTYLKLKSILSDFKIDTVLLSFSPHNLSSKADFKYFNSELSKNYYEKYYPLFDFKLIKRLQGNLGHYAFAYFKNMFLLPQINHFDNLTGGYNPRYHTKLDSSHISDAINRHYFDHEGLPTISETMIAYLDSIVNVCESNGSKLFIISPPLNYRYSKAIPMIFKNEFQNQLNRLRKKKEIVHDFTNLVTEDSLFHDGDHLNFDGSKYFSKVVKEKLRE